MIKTELEFAAKVGAQTYVADMNRYDPKIGSEILNTFGAKGPVFVVDSTGEPRYVLTDRKDDTYANVGIRRKLVFRGGNWREPTDLTPMYVWTREVKRETRPFISGISEEEARLLHATILKSAMVHADYFTALPGHKLLNPNLPYPWYCDIVSVVASEVPLELIDDIFKIPKEERNRDGYRVKFNMVSTESPQWLTPIENLVGGEHVLFGFGDDYKTIDLLRDMYDIGTRIQLVDDVVVVRLSTNANLSFAEREYLMKYLRRDNNPLRHGSLEPGQVFREREPPKS